MFPLPLLKSGQTNAYYSPTFLQFDFLAEVFSEYIFHLLSCNFVLAMTRNYQCGVTHDCKTAVVHNLDNFSGDLKVRRLHHSS